VTPNEREYQLRLKREAELLEDVVRATKVLLTQLKANSPEAYARIIEFLTTETVN